MNHVRGTYNMQHWWPSRLIIPVLMGLAFPVTSGTAEAFEVDHSANCRATETTELNRWPLRGSDMAGCEEQKRVQMRTGLTTTGSRSEGQKPPLNRWPYVFRPQDFDSATTLVVEDTHGQPIKSVRTEPDLNMWPLWPQS